MGGTARKAIATGAALIAAYLILVNYKGFVADFGSTSAGSVNLVKAFQGR